MRVRMRTTVAGPDINCTAGGIIDLDPKRAKEFVANGFAECVDQPPASPKKETAVSKAAGARRTATDKQADGE